MPKKVLFSKHAMFLPVIKELISDTEIMTFDEDAVGTLKNMDIAASSLTSLITPQLRDEALIEGGKLVATSFSLNGTGSVNAGIVRFMKDKMPAFIFPRVADLAMMILSLDKAKPDAVVVHNDVEPMLRVAATWAKVRGVPCLHVPHAIYQDVGRGAVGTDIHDIVTASHLAAAGSYQAEWYKKRGMINVKETGLPQFDKWATMLKDKIKALQLLHLSPIKPTIVYVATWRQNTNLLGCNEIWASNYMQFLDAMKVLGEQKKEVQVIVKLHPNAGQQNAQWHTDIAQKSGIKCALTHQYLDIVLQTADLVFAPFGSTTLIDASFMPNCRLMTVEGHGYFDDAVVGKVEDSVEGFAKGIIGALNSKVPDATEFRTKYAGLVDGKAYSRIAEYVREF